MLMEQLIKVILFHLGVSIGEFNELIVVHIALFCFLMLSLSFQMQCTNLSMLYKNSNIDIMDVVREKFNLEIHLHIRIQRGVLSSGNLIYVTTMVLFPIYQSSVLSM